MKQTDRVEIEAKLAEGAHIDELIELHRRARALLQRLLVSSEAAAVEADLAYNKWKAAGGPHRDNDARALRLQQGALEILKEFYGA